MQGARRSVGLHFGRGEDSERWFEHGEHERRAEGAEQKDVYQADMQYESRRRGAWKLGRRQRLLFVIETLRADSSRLALLSAHVETQSPPYPLSCPILDEGRICHNPCEDDSNLC